MEHKHTLLRAIRYGTLVVVVLFGTLAVVTLGYAFFDEPSVSAAHTSMSTTTSGATASTTTPDTVASAQAGIVHVSPPSSIRAIYMSQCAVGTPSFRASLVDMIEKGQLNAVVIDIKDYSGGISFPTEDPVLAPFVSKKCGASDMQAFVASLHAKGIYVIGRITTFQDPLYVKAHPEVAVKTLEGGVWENYGGLAFADAGARPFWIYIAELARVSYRDIGFDEINFDYIRFPSDGNLADADYTFDRGESKAQVLEEFFQYLDHELRPVAASSAAEVDVSVEPVLSADMFGFISSHTDDLGIGQVLERALPYFDFVDPMVYPSHYPKGFDGFADVNAHPYDIVYSQLSSAVQRTIATTTTVPSLAETPLQTEASQTASSTKKVVQLYSKESYSPTKIRPWLQSFDWPVPYAPDMVAAQIKATTALAYPPTSFGTRQTSTHRSNLSWGSNLFALSTT